MSSTEPVHAADSKGDPCNLAATALEFFITWLGTYLTFAPTINYALTPHHNAPFDSLPVSILIGTFSSWVAWEYADAHRLVNKKNELSSNPSSYVELPLLTTADHAQDSHRSTNYRLLIKKIGTRIGYTGDYSGVLNAFFMELVAKKWNYSAVLSMNVAIILFSYLASYPGSRVFENAYYRLPKEDNEELNADAENKKRTDCATYAGVAATGIRTFIISLFSLGMLLDRLFIMTSNTTLNISITSLWIAGIVSVLISHGFAQCEKILNTMYQQPHNDLHTQQALINERTLPSRYQQGLFITGCIALAINFYATVMSTINAQTQLDRELYLGLSALFLSLGLCPYSIPYVRTYYNQTRLANFFAITHQKTEPEYCCKI